MMRTQRIKLNDFMSGTYKEPKRSKKRGLLRAATSVTVPLMFASPAVSFASTGSQEAVTVGASQWLGEKTLQTLAHALDPLVDIMVALSFPIASVAMIGACFHFFFNNPEKAWSSMQNVGLGYVLVQLMPIILQVLKAIGGAI
jgi:hypothetical protein